MTINNNVVTVLNASAFTAITIPTSPFVRPISYYTDDGLSWIEADDEAGTNPTTVPADTKVSQRTLVNNTTGIILYVKASSGAPNLVVKIGLPEK